MNQTDWIDREWFKHIMYPLVIAGAVLGLVLGVLIGKSTGERLAFALLGVIFGGFFIQIIITPAVMFVEGLVVWIKARKAKSDAYYMIESGKIYSEQFQKVISALERSGDREAKHLLNDIYELEHDLEQVPDKRDGEEDEDKGSLLKEMSISELEQFKEAYKGNPSIVKILDGYIEAKRKATKEFQG